MDAGTGAALGVLIALTVTVLKPLRPYAMTMLAAALLLPFLPLFIVRLMASTVVWLCDVLVRGWWAAPLRWAARRLTGEK